jgi:hypothetical protein
MKSEVILNPLEVQIFNELCSTVFLSFLMRERERTENVP